VPFYIRAGKSLPVTCTEVFVQLRSPPIDFGAANPPNYLRFRLMPQASIALGASAKLPGEAMRGETVELLLCDNKTPEEMDAYERLLGDAMRGDATLFAREDSVEAAWRIVDPILGKSAPVTVYEPNTWGPTSPAVTPEGGWHDPTM
jgi:glucose-6-phosphate 1-dehydrogenase